MISYFILLFTLISSQNLIPWLRREDLELGLPSSIQIYTLNTKSSTFSSKLTGAFARFDFRDKNLEFKVSHCQDEKPKTPMDWAAEEQNEVYAVINGGYFNMQLNISASYISTNSKVYHANTINQEANKNIFPTIGSFGQFPDGSFDASQTYSYGSQLTTYRFKNANPFPGPKPQPSKGMLWPVKEGIGAGPLLVKDGIQINGNPQNFNLNNMINFRHPRSAICYDIFGRLLFVAIDGRYNDSQGVTMPQIATIMKDLNCVDALNLDGGGSTLLYANKKILNHYSDPVPRPVVSAVLVRDKYKKKNHNLISQQ